GEAANDLDNVDLLGANVLKNYVELGLLFSCGGGCRCACCGSGCNCYGSGGGYAELLLKGLYELVELTNGHVAYFVDKLIDICHFKHPPIYFKIYFAALSRGAPCPHFRPGQSRVFSALCGRFTPCFLQPLQVRERYPKRGC